MSTVISEVPRTSTSSDWDTFLEQVRETVMSHPVVTHNDYCEWFNRGEANREQVRDLVQQFYVFSNPFTVAQLLKTINAPSMEQARESCEILVNELGVVFNSGRTSPKPGGAVSDVDVGGAERLGIRETVGRIGDDPYGSPVDMAQEQGAGYAGERSDLDALGVMLYEGIGGTPPFSGRTAEELRYAHLYAPAPPLTGLVSGLPQPLTNLIGLLLAKRPSDPPASAGEFARCLVQLSGLSATVIVELPRLSGPRLLVRAIFSPLPTIATPRRPGVPA